MAELSIDSDAAVFIDLEGCLIESWFDRTIIPELKPVIDKLPNIKLFTFAIFSDEDMADFEKTPYCHEHPLLDLYALYKDKEPEYSWRTVDNVSVVYIDDRGIKHYVCVNDDKR